MSFSKSRWADPPAPVGELEPPALPAGFRAAGVAAGLKPGGLDVGVLASDAPATTAAAGSPTPAATVSGSRGRRWAISPGSRKSSPFEGGLKRYVSSPRKYGVSVERTCSTASRAAARTSG